MKINNSLIALAIAFSIPINAACSQSLDSSPKEKVASLTKEIEKDPSPELYAMRANEYKKLKMYQQSLNDINIALKGTSHEGVFHVFKARVLGDMQQFEKMVNECTLAMKSSKPGDVDYRDALAERSWAYHRLHKNAQAIGDQKEIEKLERTFGTAGVRASGNIQK